MDNDYIMLYQGGQFDLPNMDLRTYRDEYFPLEIELESDIFYELRVRYDIQPYRLRDSSNQELDEIRDFFYSHKDTFYFLFEQSELIGSCLVIRNKIQCMSVARKFHHKGYGTLLTKYAINTALKKGYPNVELRVLRANDPAISMYKKAGFRILNEEVR
ncbi:MAG: hypothetical protein A2Y33_12050 [Spirochaetes bacterium GWF1_51_8]|nr:MAG: hypothetical protein A2Y33_12050 [Spirochaetes bacterium GWF1_51_8]